MLAMRLRSVDRTTALNSLLSPGLTALVVVVGLLFVAAGLAWSLVLESRYTGPFTLLRATLLQKLRWAAKITFWQTLVLPVLGIIMPLLTPGWAQWPVFTLTCIAAWLVLFPIGMFLRRDRMDWMLKRYIRLDHAIRSGRTSPQVPARYFVDLREKMNDELCQFVEQGYEVERP